MEKRTYVLVHPLFDRFNPDELYRKNLADLFRHPRGDIILTISYTNDGTYILEINDFIDQLNPGLERVIIPTEFAKCFPKDGWDTLYQEIDRKDPLDVIVGGANLAMLRRGLFGECVGYTYHVLSDRYPRVRLDLDLCHKT